MTTVADIAKPNLFRLFSIFIWDGEGLMMTRFSAAAAISIGWFLFIAAPAMAQSDQADQPSCHAGEVLKDGVCVPDEGKCFPWQEFKNGTCVAKSTPAPADASPLPPAVSSPPPLPARCVGGSSDASGQCVCPANTHLDSASGNCQAEVKPLRKASDNVVCDGGTLSEGNCVCPAGYRLMSTNNNAAAGGTCVKTDAPNCQGGEMTVAGTCFCNGRVTMSGEDYGLELVGGKCVPKRCAEHTYLKDGKCVASADRNFGFTCRTGYIPDEADPGTASTGLHCVPDPTFCDPGVKRKDGSCPKSSAVAIDCFEAKCVCRDAHADWVNYLCECAAPYRNVNGSCVTDTTDHPVSRPEDKTKPAEPGEQKQEPAQPQSCGHGMIRAHGDCVPARRKSRGGSFEGVPPGVTGYEDYLRRGSRMYRFNYPSPEHNY
jgi:hypothetical protein